MTTVPAPTLTLADLSRMMDDMRRTDEWKTTPIGELAQQYLTWKRIEWGAKEQTIRNREPVLYRLSLDEAHRPVSDFEPPGGSEIIRAFLYRNWGDGSEGTFANRVTILRDFFAWAVREDKLLADPMGKISRPRNRTATARQAHEHSTIVRLIRAQPSRRDRIAIQLMARQGLRKNELRLVQFRYLDAAQGSLWVFGKGGKTVPVPLFEDIRRELELYMLETQAAGDEYLLYPTKMGRRGSWPLYRAELIWENRVRPLSQTGMHHWWRRCLERAGVEPFPMHELRHTAGTAFHLAHGDYELTRQFLRHERIATTATYIHVPSVHVQAAMRRMPDFWGDE